MSTPQPSRGFVQTLEVMPAPSVPIAPGMLPNPTLWTRQPMMPTVQGQRYRGRVFIEWWPEGAQLVEAGGPPVAAAALAALLGGRYTLLPAADLPWTDEPVTNFVGTPGFMGRVAIEVYDDGAVVGVSGADLGLLPQAADELKAHVRDSGCEIFACGPTS